MSLIEGTRLAIWSCEIWGGSRFALLPEDSPYLRRMGSCRILGPARKAPLDVSAEKPIGSRPAANA